MSKRNGSEKVRIARIKELVSQRSEIRCENPCCNVLLDINTLTIDHIRPRCLGYRLTLTEGWQILCLNCNHDKGMLSIDYKTKTFIVEPFIFGLNQGEFKYLLKMGHRPRGSTERKINNGQKTGRRISTTKMQKLYSLEK